MTRRLDDDPPTAVEYERQAQAEEAARTCFACGHVDTAHRARTEAEQREHAARDAARKATIRACDGHRGHGEAGCGFGTSTWPGGECPMCGGAMVDREAVKAERRPVAGWREVPGGRWVLDGADGERLATVDAEPEGIYWSIEIARSPAEVKNWKRAASVPAAQLAAEDALRAVAAEIAAVLR